MTVNSRLFLVLSITILSLQPELSKAQAIIAGHNAVEEFDQIPTEWIEAARELTIHYGHTSHGQQILAGLGWIENNYGAPYNFNDSTYYCSDNTSGSCNSTAESYSPCQHLNIS